MSEEKFKFRCKHCEKKLKAPVDLVGERISCPHCQKPIVIPDPAQVMDETNTALSAIPDLKITKSPAGKSQVSDIDPDFSEAVTGKLPSSETETNKLDHIEGLDETKPKAKKKKPTVKKKLSMGATKSVKLTDSQKKLVRPKKKFFIK